MRLVRFLGVGRHEGAARFKALGAGDEAREAVMCMTSAGSSAGFKALGAGDEAREAAEQRLEEAIAAFQSPRCGR